MCLTGTVSASEGWDLLKEMPRKPADPVEVVDIVVRPGGHLFSPDTRWQVSPKAHLAIGVEDERHDGTPQPGDGTTGLGTAMGGVLAHYSADQGIDLGVDGEIGRTARFNRAYADRDLTWGHLRLGAGYQNDELASSLRLGAKRSREPEFAGEAPTKRDTLTSLITLGRVGPGLTPELEAGWERTHYLEDTALFTAEAGSHQDPGALGRLGWRTRLDNYLYLVAAGSARVYDVNDNFNNSRTWTGGAGWRSALSGVEGFVEAGVQQRRYDDVFRHDPAYADQRVTVPWFAGKLQWNFENDDTLALFATSRIEDSRSANADWRIGPRVQGNLRLLRYLLGHATVGYERALGSGPQDETLQKRGIARQAEVWLDYLLDEGLAVGVRLSWEDYRSNLEERYQTTNLRVGTSVLW